MVKFGNWAYFTNDDYTTIPINQENDPPVVGAAGGLMFFKIKVQNDGTKRDRLVVRSSNHPDYREKFLKGSKNVPAVPEDAIRARISIG